MREDEWIRLACAGFKRDQRQKNSLFECDAELLELNGQVWAMTLDQFSPEEDLFRSEKPEDLGANLAVATLSDLFAAGAQPEFFMQGLTIPKNGDEAFVRAVIQGIRRILSEAECSLCGGDLGTAAQWRFSGFALGRVRGNRPLMRILPKQPHSIWVTGWFGDANRSALLNLPTPPFELRTREAAIIHARGTSCMDTSGGLLDTLWWLHALNPGMRFEIDLDRVPLAPEVKKTITNDLPLEAFLLGGAGEYELVFSIPEPISAEVVPVLQSIQATCIGAARFHGESDLWLRKNGKIISKMQNAPPCGREVNDREEYIQSVIRMAKDLAGE